MPSIIYGNYIHTYMEDTCIYIHMRMEDAYVYAEKKTLENWKGDIISLPNRARFSLFDELCVFGQVPFSLSAFVFPTA